MLLVVGWGQCTLLTAVTGVLAACMNGHYPERMPRKRQPKAPIKHPIPIEVVEDALEQPVKVYLLDTGWTDMTSAVVMDRP